MHRPLQQTNVILYPLDPLLTARKIARRAEPQLAAGAYCATMKSLKKLVSGAFYLPIYSQFNYFGHRLI